jgi:hypothetical protein
MSGRHRLGECTACLVQALLSTTAAPGEYAGRITALLKNHCNYANAKMLAIAHKSGALEQRQALSDVMDRQAGQRPSDKRV